MREPSFSWRTAVIGVSTKGKAFTREVVEAMAELNERPIIFALSNPTDHAECTAEEALTWSKGRALYAAGVQFPPVRVGDKTYVTGQANNLYIFPAVGLAIYATRAKRVTDEMFITAAQAVADQVTQAELDAGLLYPPQTDILQTEVATAIRVCEVIFDRGLAGVERPKDIRAFVKSQPVRARRDGDRDRIARRRGVASCPAAWTATNLARTHEQAIRLVGRTLPRDPRLNRGTRLA